MKWDQGLLTMFLIGGVTAITAAACGPSNSMVTVLPLPHGMRQMNVCANNIGSRESKVVGTGAVTKVGEAPQVATTAICKQVYTNGVKSYKWSTEDYGYKLGADDAKQMNIEVAIQVYIDKKKTDEAMPIVKKIADLCAPQISKMWPRQRLGSTLKVTIDPVVLDGSFQNRKAMTSVHLLTLSGDDVNGYVIDHWSDRARFTAAVETSPDYKACMAKNTGNPQAKFLCASDSYPQVDASNSAFCSEVAVMVGHYLGLSQDLDPDCDGTETAAPGPKAAKIVPPVKTFMSAAADPANQGDAFWKNVVFTESDRRIVIDRGCAIPSVPGPASSPTPATKPAPTATPVQTRTRRVAAPVTATAPSILSVSGSGLAGK